MWHTPMRNHLIHLQTLNGHVIRTLNNNSQFGIIPVLGSHTHTHNISVNHYPDTLTWISVP